MLNHVQRKAENKKIQDLYNAIETKEQILKRKP